MKQTLERISNTSLGILIVAILALLASAFCSCSTAKKPIETPTSLPWRNEAPAPPEATANEREDTTKTWIPFQKFNGKIVLVDLDSLINSNVVIDTIYQAGEEIVYHDTIPCPGLDTVIPVSFTRIIPQRAVPVSITILDTMYLPAPPCPTLPPPAKIRPPESFPWAERILWLGGVLFLLLGYWIQYKQRTGRNA